MFATTVSWCLSKDKRHMWKEMINANQTVLHLGLWKINSMEDRTDTKGLFVIFEVKLIQVIKYNVRVQNLSEIYLLSNFRT